MIADLDSYWEKQVVLITGGSGLIGQHLTKHFYSLGCKVAFTYFKNERRAQEMVSSINSPRYKSYQADLQREEQVNTVFDRVEGDLGNISILVNNAGTSTRNLMATMTAEEWHTTIGSYLTASFFCCKRALVPMLRSKFGRIINISSVAALSGSIGTTHYSAAKAGVIGMTRALASEVAGKGITVNSAVLGLIEASNTPSAKIKGKLRDEFISVTPLQRAGKVEEVAHLIEYISSFPAAYMTGQALTLDGGYSS